MGQISPNIAIAAETRHVEWEADEAEKTDCLALRDVELLVSLLVPARTVPMQQDLQPVRWIIERI